MRLGRWQMWVVLEGTFALDGGSMFGIVPKPLWSRRHPADERNRITMALRAMLLTDGQRRILVDCGIGPRFDERDREIYRHEPRPGGLVGALGTLGFSPESITDVIATHLHFDHVGGLLTPSSDGRLRPTFPGALVHLQEDAWNWARAPSAWDLGSFFEQDFPIWEEALRLHLLSGDAEIAPGVRVQATAGHTPGHQIVTVGEGATCAVFCGDLIPTAAHVRLPYIMAYDHRPQQTLEEKKVLLAQALEEDWVLVFEHDPWMTACRLEELDGRLVPGEQICPNAL